MDSQKQMDVVFDSTRLQKRRFVVFNDAADVTKQIVSPRVGKVTHPSGAPYNHLLLVWSAGPVNGGYTVHQLVEGMKQFRVPGLELPLPPPAYR